MADDGLGYYLPVTVVRITGTEYKTVDATGGTPTTIESAELTATLSVRGDTGKGRNAFHRLEDPDHTLTTSDVKVTFAPDRRIVTIAATSAGQGPAVVKSLATIGGTVLGAAVALTAAPAVVIPTAAAGAVAALAKAAITGVAEARSGAGSVHLSRAVRFDGNLDDLVGVDELDLEGLSDEFRERAKKEAAAERRAETRRQRVREAEARAQMEKLALGYLLKHPEESAVLGMYLAAIARLTRAHALAAMIVPEPTSGADLGRLEDLSTALKRTRAQAAQLQEHYEGWLAAHKVKAVAATVDHEFVVDELPSADEVRRWFDTRDIAGPARRVRQPDAAETPWVAFGRLHGVCVSVDWVGDAMPVDSDALVHDDEDAIELRYRCGRVALLRTWKVGEVEEPAPGRDVDAVEPYYTAAIVKTEHAHVIPGGALAVEAELALPVGAFESGTLSVEFDAAGHLTTVGSTRTVAAGTVTAVADGLSGVQSGLDAGAKLAGSFVPGSVQQAILDRQGAIGKAEKELGGLTSTKDAEPDPGDEQRSKLVKDVEEAELRARLEIARAQAADPRAGLVVVHVGP